MQCCNDACDGTETRVIETYKTPAHVHRVRRCDKCGTRYITVEVLAPLQEIPESSRKVNRRSKA